MNQKRMVCFVYAFLVFMFMGMNPDQLFAQEISGELVFDEPFEGELIPGWIIVQQRGATAENLGLIETGPNGGDALVLLSTTPAGVTLNNLQYTNEESLVRPEDSDLYDWRVTFWIHVRTIPFTIRPIIAMNVDPWSGSDVDVPIEQAEVWTFVDIILPAQPFLNTDPLLFIFHMGNPGDANGENEIWLDDLKVYLLNQETGVNDWSIY